MFSVYSRKYVAYFLKFSALTSLNKILLFYLTDYHRPLNAPNDILLSVIVQKKKHIIITYSYMPFITFIKISFLIQFHLIKEINISYLALLLILCNTEAYFPSTYNFFNHTYMILYIKMSIWLATECKFINLIFK